MTKSNIITLLLLLSFSFLPVKSFSQVGPPPPMAVPENDNKPLIDKIITVTNYEIYFKKYCFEAISKKAIDESWNSEKVAEIKAKIKLDDFKFTIYNLFAKYSKEELNQLLETYKKDKSNQENNLIVKSSMVESNLKSYAKNLVGEYN